MKRIFILLFAIGLTAMSSTSVAAMSNSRIRKETRFLTDKMAYELGLSTQQYNDVYEINYDFIHSIRYLMDDVARGYEWALDEYYNYLDLRNDDLRWVLSDLQYRRFMGLVYFYRPIYAYNNGWGLRIYVHYTNQNYFYYPKPYHYRSYSGGNYRRYFGDTSYYCGRYDHSYYRGSYRVRGNDNAYRSSRRSDFGTVTIRPNTYNRYDSRSNSGSSVRRENIPTRGDYYSSRRNSSDNNSRMERNYGTSTRENSNESSSRRSVTRDNNSSSSRGNSSWSTTSSTRRESIPSTGETPSSPSRSSESPSHSRRESATPSRSSESSSYSRRESATPSRSSESSSYSRRESATPTTRSESTPSTRSSSFDRSSSRGDSGSSERTGRR